MRLSARLTCCLGVGERGYNAYFHDFESYERGDPLQTRPSVQSQRPCMFAVLEHNVVLQVDSFAFYDLEFQEGLLRDIESVLEGV